MDAKEYYRTGKHSVWKLSDMRKHLLDTILSTEPDSVFEFGCGGGDNLHILRQAGMVNLFGLDVNRDEVTLAKQKGLTHVNVGDERVMSHITGNCFGVSFTCGVLDHIPPKDIEFTVSELTRITNDILYICETQEVPAVYYYPHNYEELGFTKEKQFDNGYAIWSKLC